MRTTLAIWMSLCGIMVSCVGAQEVADPDPNRFAKEIDNFTAWDRKNATPDDPILFVGSSSIRMWKTHESFPDWPVVNRGFGGSHISDVLHFFDRVVTPYAPKCIVFYAGDNDVAGGKPAAQVLRDYRCFVDRISARFPDTSIVYLTIKPSGRRWSLWPEMDKANGMIEAFCTQHAKLYFADLGTPLLDAEGKPDNSFFCSDQLHLNDKGYEVWAKKLRPVVEKALAVKAN